MGTMEQTIRKVVELEPFKFMQTTDRAWCCLNSGVVIMRVAGDPAFKAFRGNTDLCLGGKIRNFAPAEEIAYFKTVRDAVHGAYVIEQWRVDARIGWDREHGKT